MECLTSFKIYLPIFRAHVISCFLCDVDTMAGINFLINHLVYKSSEIYMLFIKRQIIWKFYFRCNCSFYPWNNFLQISCSSSSNVPSMWLVPVNWNLTDDWMFSFFRIWMHTFQATKAWQGYRDYCLYQNIVQVMLLMHWGIILLSSSFQSLSSYVMKNCLNSV